MRVNFQDPDEGRPFYEEERRRERIRAEENERWVERLKAKEDSEEGHDEKAKKQRFEPTEGGPDPVICDAAYYARRVGLDIEAFKVQTEDGFLIDLWHVYDPTEYTPLPAESRGPRGPDLFTTPHRSPTPGQKRKYPILLQHGLLQSAGAYCVNDDDSLAFYLAKSGYDVWLGNNRCGFHPQHTLLSPSDPRMWAWNIRAMGVLDLPALISRVLYETGFPKLGLVAHSQGTTQTFVALAKEQRPELGEKISVFCALAPAAYAGPLIGKMYFKFMRVISPYMFRVWFGIHSFIPFMMTMHSWLPGKMYGKMGYKVFSFLFNWSDERWDRGVRDRLFRFSPVYVSAESMRWWLGRECFARQKCILQTREEWRLEDKEDKLEEYYEKVKEDDEQHKLPEEITREVPMTPGGRIKKRVPKGSTAWYDERCPPFALWVAGSDDLVDGRRLLRRLNNGREPHVRVVHEKIIEEYEHLDVIWAMDSIDKVGREVKEVLWKTCTEREQCVTPEGCEDVQVWEEIARVDDEEDQSESGDESEESDFKWPEKKEKGKRGWMKRLFR